MQYLHSHDFCSQEMATSGINDKTISSTLKFIGENRDAVLRWMRSRLMQDSTIEPKAVLRFCDDGFYGSNDRFRKSVYERKRI
jgi:hypothetical protein